MSGPVTQPAPGDGAETPDGHPHAGVPMPVAQLEDPHLRARHHPRRVENFVAVFFLLGILGVCAFGAAYWVNAKPIASPSPSGCGLSASGYFLGLTAWGEYLMPQGPFVVARTSCAGATRSGPPVGRPGATEPKRGGQAEQVPWAAAGDPVSGSLASWPSSGSCARSGPSPATAWTCRRLAAQQPAGRCQSTAARSTSRICGPAAWSPFSPRAASEHRRGAGLRPDGPDPVQLTPIPAVAVGGGCPTAGRPGPPTATWPTRRCAPTSGARSVYYEQLLELLAALPPVDVQRAQRGRAPVRPRPPPGLPSCR